MRLHVAVALVGSPAQHDEVIVTFSDGSGLRLRCVPHTSFDHYVWKVEGINSCSFIQAAFEGTRRRGVRRGSLTCYADDDQEIVVGKKLHLVLVPQGNMHDWPRFTSDSNIEHIDVL